MTTLPDSATLWALLECDSLGQVLLRELSEERGRHTSTSARLVSNGRQTAIRVSARSEAEHVIVRRTHTSLSSSRTTVTDHHDETVQTPPRRSRLADNLRAIAVFLLGFAGGWLTRWLRQPFKR